MTDEKLNAIKNLGKSFDACIIGFDDVHHPTVERFCKLYDEWLLRPENADLEALEDAYERLYPLILNNVVEVIKI